VSPRSRLADRDSGSETSPDKLSSPRSHNGRTAGAGAAHQNCGLGLRGRKLARVWDVRMWVVKRMAQGMTNDRDSQRDETGGATTATTRVHATQENGAGLPRRYTHARSCRSRL